jgi:hypothetical protein
MDTIQQSVEIQGDAGRQAEQCAAIVGRPKAARCKVILPETHARVCGSERDPLFAFARDRFGATRFFDGSAQQKDRTGQADEEQLHGEDIRFCIPDIKKVMTVQGAPDQREADHHDHATRAGGAEANGSPDDNWQRQVQKRRDIAARDRGIFFEREQARNHKNCCDQ